MSEIIRLHDLRPAKGAKTAKTRVGRGEGGKGGKTAGRGTKGTKARKNVSPAFEGGQIQTNPARAVRKAPRPRRAEVRPLPPVSIERMRAASTPRDAT